MDKKFSELVNDSIKKNELGRIYGGFDPNDLQNGSGNNAHACSSYVCSDNIEPNEKYCTQGDAVCDSKLN